MLSKTILKKLQDQFALELQAAYLYLSLAAFVEQQSLDGFAHWMKQQAKEELEHAMKVYGYILDKGHAVEFQPVAAPKDSPKSLVKAVTLAYEHEQHLAEVISKISHAAQAEGDHTTYSFLNWFLQEQVEEVASLSTLCDRVKLADNEGGAILRLDDELSSRA